MVSIVIYGIIAIALAAAAGYAMLVFTSTAQQTTQMQENSVRMEQAVTALRASLRALDGNGVLYAPAGTAPTAQTNYTTLPASLGVVSAAPWGAPYQYCPVAQIASQHAANVSALTTVTSVDGSTYPIGAYEDSNTNGVPYVVSGGFTGLPTNTAAGSYLAFIVSSVGPSQPVPGCDKITVNATTGNVTVSGGTVRAVTGGIPFTQRAVAAIDRLELYVANDGVGSGNFSGSDQSNLMPITSAVALWHTLQPRLTVLYLAEGNSTAYTIDGDIGSSTPNLDDLNAEDARPAATAENPTLVFSNLPRAATTPTLKFVNTTPLIFKTPIAFEGIAVSLAGSNYNLNAYAPLTFKNATLASGSANIEAVNLYGSNLDLIDVPSISSISLSTTQSKISVYNLLSTTVLNTYNNTSFNLSNSSLYFGRNQAAPGTITNPGAVYSFTGSIASNADTIHTESSNIYADYYTAINVSSSTVSLYNTKLFDHGNLTALYLGGMAGSTLSFFNGSVAINVPSGSGYPGIQLAGSSLNSYVPITIISNGTNYGFYANSSQANLFSPMTVTQNGSQAAVYLENGSSLNNSSSISISSAASNDVSLASGSSLNQINGSLTASAAGVPNISSKSGSSVNFSATTATLSSSTAATNAYIDNIYAESSSLNISTGSTVNASGSGFRSGMCAEGSRINFIGSTFSSSTTYTSGAIYLSRASSLNALSSNLKRGGSSPCVFIENPIISTSIPAGQSLGNYALLYPDYQGTVDTGPANGTTVDPVYINGNVPAVGSSANPSLTVDPNSLQTYLFTHNVGMSGNLNLAAFVCQ